MRELPLPMQPKAKFQYLQDGHWRTHQGGTSPVVDLRPRPAKGSGWFVELIWTVLIALVLFISLFGLAALNGA